MVWSSFYADAIMMNYIYELRIQICHQDVAIACETHAPQRLISAAGDSYYAIVNRMLVHSIRNFSNVEYYTLLTEFLDSAVEEVGQGLGHSPTCTYGTLALVLEELETEEDLFIPREVINLIGMETFNFLCFC